MHGRFALAALTLTAACGGTMMEEPTVGAILRDASGAQVGMARFSEQPDGTVMVRVDVTNVSPGTHGVHIHETGQCEPTGDSPFSSAGGHFNPTGASHGVESANGPHAGDLPNMNVGADGRGLLQTTTSRISLGAGANSLFDADGSAVVVHAGPDDQRSDPAGDAGPRVACGVVERR